MHRNELISFCITEQALAEARALVSELAVSEAEAEAVAAECSALKRAAAEAAEAERVTALQRAEELFRQLSAKREAGFELQQQRAAKKAKQQKSQGAASVQ